MDGGMKYEFSEAWTSPGFFCLGGTYPNQQCARGSFANETGMFLGADAKVQYKLES